jgi:hypothetical protein
MSDVDENDEPIEVENPGKRGGVNWSKDEALAVSRAWVAVSENSGKGTVDEFKAMMTRNAQRGFPGCSGGVVTKVIMVSTKAKKEYLLWLLKSLPMKT